MKLALLIRWATILVLALATPVVAGAPENRILLSMRQAALVQSVGLAACFAMNGVDTARQNNTAIEHLDTYGTVLMALRDGHEWLELDRLDDPALRASVGATETIWNRFQPAIRQQIAGDWHSVVMHQILTQTGPVAESAMVLAGQFLDTYAQAASDPARIPALRLAGEQQVLTQKALRLACLIRFDLGAEALRDDLRATLARIDADTRRLAEGDGVIVPPPNARITRNFRTATLFWSKMRPTLDAVLSDAPPDILALQKMLKLNASVLKQFNQAVEGYLAEG